MGTGKKEELPGRGMLSIYGDTVEANTYGRRSGSYQNDQNGNVRNQRWDFQSFYAEHEPQLRAAPLYSVLFSSMYRNTWITDSCWSEESFLSQSHSLVFTRYTRNSDRQKSSGQTHLFNICTIGDMDRTSGQPQVKLSL
jgi:hypothetical protein